MSNRFLAPLALLLMLPLLAAISVWVSVTVSRADGIHTPGKPNVGEQPKRGPSRGR